MTRSNSAPSVPSVPSSTPPTLKLDPTDTSANTISIDFTNDLPYDGECTPNVPTCLNVSNLHFHGLHVSPSSTAAGVASDNVLIEVMTEDDPNHPDQNTQEYCVVLPTFHAPGTHWYHPHRHGSTAIQLEDGMVGAIIVKEPDEDHNMVPDSRDKVWVMQEIIDGNVYTGASNSAAASYLINGLYQPTITIQPGQWQRWRFINGTATPRGLMNLKLRESDSNTPVNMYLIAVDGISFYGNSPQATTGWDMAPGNRADFLIWVEEEGTYEIYKDTYSGGGATASSRTTQVLATVVVSGADGGDSDPSEAEIQGSLPSYLQPISESEVVDGSGTVRARNINFVVAAPGNYQINDMQYSSGSCDPDDPNSDNCQQVDLNTAEVWYLSNLQSASSFTGGSAHPFHIHVNPFQIVGDKINPDGPDDSSNWRWWDSIAVDPGECVPIVHRFTDYDGEFVLHCHILIHEDQGMMMNVKVNGDGTGPCEQLSTPGFEPSGDAITCDYIAANVTPPTINGNTCTNPLTCQNP
jgi:FtsP/CotA-like multicopper oxidase with cupredoxin domain